MSDDDLRDLRAALDRAAPRPEPSRRAADLARARAAFDALHAAPPRPGWRERLRGLWAPGAAGALAALAAGLVLVLPVGRDLLRAPPAPEVAQEAQPYAEATAAPAAEAASDAAPEAEAARIKVAPESALAPPPAPAARMAPAADAPLAETLAAPAAVVEAVDAGGYEGLRAALLAGRPAPAVALDDLLAALPPDLSGGPAALLAPWDPDRTLRFAPADPGRAAPDGLLATGGGVTASLWPVAAAPLPSEEARWGAAVVGWGLILQGDAQATAWGRDALLALARSARGPDPTGARAEAIDLMARSTAP